MANIRLLSDEDVRPLLGEILRQRGYDAIHVLEVDRTGMNDADQLSYAASAQRAVITHNVRDFILLDQQYHEEKKEHFGILLSDQIPLRDLLRRTLRFLGHRTAEEIKNNIFWLSE